MKKNIFILFLTIFNIFNSKDYTNEKSKEIRHYFISTKDFEYFKYDISNCNSNMGKKYELNFDNAEAKLYFYLNNKGEPTGIWTLNMRTENELVTYIEECYKDGKMVKKYIYYYNSLSKKRILTGGFIYYDKKGIEYYVTYNSDDQSIKAIYFGMNNNGYSFYLKDNKELVSMKTLFIEISNSKSLYETYKNEINKILELEN